MACLCLLVAPSTHSGGLTYSVQVLPAASAKGAPSILIAYNSQSGRCYLCHKREFKIQARYEYSYVSPPYEEVIAKYGKSE